MPRDLYDILEVARDTGPEELRVAYRRLALVWHPDKNAGRQEEATVRFKEIQNAYEVLSDKNERAWYDSHREEIIRGGTTHYAGADTGAPPAEEGINLWAYFSTSAFSGYGDKGQGFYAVYGKVFEDLAKMEMQAARRNGLDFSAPPSLGKFSSPYSDVSAFYSHWLNFSTVKEFLWAAEYNLAVAPNRQVRRLMETENAKKVRAMRKKFNEEVRALAAWCKKRDKRVMERALEQKKLQALREQEEAKAHKEKLARKKAEQAALYVEQDWAVNEEKLTDEGWWGDETEKKEGDEEQQELYCVACGKSFKSDKQWKNHEKSRKHLERAAALKEALLQEEDALSDDDGFDTASEGDDVSRGHDEVREEGSRHVTDEEILAQLDAQEAEMNGRQSEEEGERFTNKDAAESDEENSEKNGSESSDAGEQEEDGLDGLLQMHSKKKRSSTEELKEESDEESGEERASSRGSEEESSEASAAGSDDEGLGDLLRLHQTQKGSTRRKGRPKSKAKEKTEAEENTEAEEQTETEDARGDVEEDNETEKPEAADVVEGSISDKEASTEGLDGEEVSTSEVLAEKEEDSEREGPPSKVSAKVKKARRAANRAKKEGAKVSEVMQEVTSAKGRKGKRNKAVEPVGQTSCVTCAEVFDSRTQLFKHLTASGHAIPKRT